MDTSHAKIMEYLPDSDRLTLRVGVGWKEGYVGQYQVPPDLDTPIGQAFALSLPVPIPDYAAAALYRYPTILKDHGCVASLNVPVWTDRGNFGVLELDQTSARAFTDDDVHFLTGLGNTMARAVELRRVLNAMETALDEKQLLVREMNHRIKNNLGLVGVMLAKHAFAERDGGEIELGFRQEGAGWRLWVDDNGRGSPPLLAEGPGKSFGRQLLATLAARLNAEVRSATDRGTRVEVSSGLTG